MRILYPLLTLSLLTMAGCSERGEPLSIPFAATFGALSIDCGAAGAELRLSDMRLYVSNVELLDSGGGATPLRLLPDQRWQSGELALIDLEDGADSCANGTLPTNAAVRGVAPARKYTGVRFVVGVPFDRNHADPLAASVPLDDPAMHWHWRSGYKFLRAGVTRGEDGFWMHLGSAGCRGTVQNITACRFPNRVTVELRDFVPGRDAVALDFGALLTGTEIDDGKASDCSSGPAETDCVAPFAALGLDHATGAAHGLQSAFRAHRIKDQ